MSRLVAVLLVVLLAVTGCARTSTRQGLTSTGLEEAQPSELQACAAVCLVRLQSCTDTGADMRCAAENAACVHSCEHAQSGRVYAFYCQAEIIARRGLVLSDSSCTGAMGGTLDEQRSGCERGFEPPAGALAYTVACRPVLTWVDAGVIGARARSSQPTLAPSSRPRMP
jgi:hypothetical protein